MNEVKCYPLIFSLIMFFFFTGPDYTVKLIKYFDQVANLQNETPLAANIANRICGGFFSSMVCKLYCTVFKHFFNVNSFLFLFLVYYNNQLCNFRLMLLHLSQRAVSVNFITSQYTVGYCVYIVLQQSIVLTVYHRYSNFVCENLMCI